ncbi:MAG: AgmX/PglI C-terminal domain-containing protein [Myxococcales bacterium]|nr:AgmX/PglI C-terminal domain-containing protein [Myxococcales bacterium]
MSFAALFPVFALALGVGALKPPGIEQSRVEEVVADRRVGLSICYEDGRDRNPKLQGNVGVVMEVDDTGKVRDAKSTRATTMPDKEVVSCVLDVMKTLDFGAQDKPQTVRYTVRFVEEPPAKDE